MIKPNLKHLTKGDNVSAKEYNRLVDMVASLANSLYSNSYSDSTGFHTRRMSAGTTIRIRSAKIQAGGVPSDDPPDNTTYFTCKLLGSDGAEIGDTIKVYPRTHLGVNPYDEDVWPDLAAADIISVYKDVDTKWWIAGTVFDDTVSCT